MMLLRPQTPHDQASLLHRKRKADAPPENNERLSKRLSLLNLEHNGQKLYVPVEATSRTTPPPTTSYSSSHPPPAAPSLGDEVMHLDDTKHKVYIYSLDDELASDLPDDPVPDPNRILFLPDIEKHLLAQRLPAHVVLRPPPPDPDAAAKQLVLYRVPASLTVPEERDSVRRAVIEARARVRERLRAEREGGAGAPSGGAGAGADADGDVDVDGPVVADGDGGDDPDAMELD